MATKKGIAYHPLMKHLPHLAFLRSFEAAARHLSFTSAAEELNCSQAAVSNHVRSLEDYLGRPLFVRFTRKLKLTDLGKAYLPSVQSALRQINTATELLISETHSREVVVSCPVSLAANWLSMVIAEFNNLHPDIEILVHGTVWSDVDERVSDIMITMESMDTASPAARLLWPEKLTLVCAPGYQPDGERLRDPMQLKNASLILAMSRQTYWDRIAESLSIDPRSVDCRFQTNITSLALELAAQGLGCAAVPRSLAQLYLDRGLLIEPFDVSADSPLSYFASFDAKSASPAVKLFWNWLTNGYSRRETSVLRV